MKLEEIYALFTQCSGVSTDTRTIQEGTFFVGLKGPNFDGGAFAEKALESGAKCVLVNREHASNNPNIIDVDDTLKTLQDLANVHRKTWKHHVIGITGTNGKTTTKELLQSVLSTSFKSYCTAGNFNNHIGLPLTILNAPKEQDFTILEMGASKNGDIRELCEIGEPDFGIITNVGIAHLEGFGSAKTIEKTKMELYNHVDAHGKGSFWNTDFPQLKPAKTLDTFCSQSASAFISRITQFLPCITVELKDSKTRATTEIQTHLTGAYNISNINAVVAIAHYFNIPLNKIKEGLSNYQPSNNRSQVVTKGDKTFVLDAYNANPSSVKEAMNNIAEMQKGNFSNPFVLIGDMKELGSESLALHQAVVDHCGDLNLSGHFVGTEFDQCTIPSNSSSIQLSKSLSAGELDRQIGDKDLILVKGSRSMKMDELIAQTKAFNLD